MFDTAGCYHDGYSTGEKDYITTYAWYALAAERFETNNGDSASPGSMAETFMQRTARRGKLSSEQIQQASDLAKQLHKEIAGSYSAKD